MEDWLKQIKDSWNATSDSDWHQSLRTDEKISELVNNPLTAAKLEAINNWENNPMAALPAWLTIVSQK